MQELKTFPYGTTIEQALAFFKSGEAAKAWPEHDVELLRLGVAYIGNTTLHAVYLLNEPQDT